MLERLSGWMSLLDNAEKKVLQEMSIGDVIDAHQKWKAWLQDYVDGKSDGELDPASVSREDQSLVGKWIHGHAAGHFQHLGAFYTLRAMHAQFHMIAGDVARKMQESNHAAARELMNTQLLKTSHKLVYALIELDKQLAAEE